MQDLLIQRFKDTFTDMPKWAWPFHPPIPLVGRNYKPGKGLLIYASAENLSWRNKRDAPDCFVTEGAWNRYRVQYEQGDGPPRGFFPDVGIQPVTDGGLFAAGLFVAERAGLPFRRTPRAFLETMAVTNWCKFSIRSANNRDYVNDTKKLTASLPFVVGELALLHPAIVLIPKQLWADVVFRAAMRGASPRSRFLPVPQSNSTVVNCKLVRFDLAARRLRKRLADTPLHRWMGQLNRMNRDNAWRYIALLNALLTTR